MDFMFMQSNNYIQANYVVLGGGYLNKGTLRWSNKNQ